MSLSGARGNSSESTNSCLPDSLAQIVTRTRRRVKNVNQLFPQHLLRHLPHGPSAPPALAMDPHEGLPLGQPVAAHEKALGPLHHPARRQSLLEAFRLPLQLPPLLELGHGYLDGGGQLGVPHRLH